MQSAFGEDPSISKALKVDVHPELISRWQFYASNGMPKEDRENLLKKYLIPEGLKAPTLNDEIKSVLKEKAVKRDGYRFEAQKPASVALTALGSAVTMINTADQDGLDQEVFLERLADAAKLMADVQYNQSETRKAFIYPTFVKPLQALLKKSKPDDLLFGNGLKEKIKQTKDIEKISLKNH